MLESIRQLKLKLKELLLSKEAEDPNYLRYIFDKNPNFMRYQYSVGTFHQSVYNNVTLCYRHYERVCMLLMLTNGMCRILDVGGGYGDLSLELSNSGKNVILLDFDTEKLLIAKYRFNKFDCKGGLVRGDAHHLPFRDNSFDVSFSNQVVEHVAGPIKIVLENLRVSKSKAIVMCANNSLAFPGANFIYYRLLTKKEVEIVPNLGSYDKILYLNCQFFPLNSIFAILVMTVIIGLPIMRKIFSGNVVKIYHKRRSQRKRVKLK